MLLGLFCLHDRRQGSKTFSKAKSFLYREPELSHQLLGLVTKTTIAYLKAQISSGADLVQLFDSWAGILTHQQYEEFGMKYIRKICDAVHEAPVTVFAKGAYSALDNMKGINCETIGLDWNMSISNAKTIFKIRKHYKGIWIHVSCMVTTI